MGITAEKVAAQWKVSREEQDMFAADSHRRARARDRQRRVQGRDHAVSRSSSVCPISRRAKSGRRRARSASDEGPRRDTSPEALAKLQAGVRRQGHGHRRQQLADVRRRGRRRAHERSGAEALQPDAARRASWATRSPACRRTSWASGRSRRFRRCSQQAGLRQDDIDWIELNEAFAAQALAVINELGLDRAKVNPLGGAIALGHPLGATGAIRVATLLHGLRRHARSTAW